MISLEIWGDAAESRIAAALGAALPAVGASADLPGEWRAIRVEPSVWWLSGPREGLAARQADLDAALGEDGAAVDLTGAFARLEVCGPAWRTLLMFGGVFDAEDPDFGPGRTAGTILHHLSVRYDVVDEDRLHIFVGSSYAGDLLHHLRAAAARLDLA